MQRAIRQSQSNIESNPSGAPFVEATPGTERGKFVTATDTNTGTMSRPMTPDLSIFVNYPNTKSRRGKFERRNGIISTDLTIFCCETCCYTASTIFTCL
jgi:hypothetical protein